MTDERMLLMQAVREAAASSVTFKGSSLANGLRCIRTFERVNGIAFDPRNPRHRDTVWGMGVHEALFRRLERLKQEKS